MSCDSYQCNWAIIVWQLVDNLALCHPRLARRMPLTEHNNCRFNGLNVCQTSKHPTWHTVQEQQVANPLCNTKVLQTKGCAALCVCVCSQASCATERGFPLSESPWYVRLESTLAAWHSASTGQDVSVDGDGFWGYVVWDFASNMINRHTWW